MKLRELIKVKDSLTNFANIRLSSAQDNYNVFKLYKQAEDEITNYNAQRDKIIIEYGEKDSEGNVSVQQNNPNFDKVIQAIVELEDLDIKIKFEKISVKSSELNLSAVDIFNLENFGLIEIKEGD
jgi:hypothetical protein